MGSIWMAGVGGLLCWLVRQVFSDEVFQVSYLQGVVWRCIRCILVEEVKQETYRIVLAFIERSVLLGQINNEY